MLHVIMLRIVPGISIHMQLCCLFQAVVTIHIYIYIYFLQLDNILVIIFISIFIEHIL